MLLSVLLFTKVLTFSIVLFAFAEKTKTKDDWLFSVPDLFKTCNILEYPLVPWWPRADQQIVYTLFLVKQLCFFGMNAKIYSILICDV